MGHLDRAAFPYAASLALYRSQLDGLMADPPLSLFGASGPSRVESCSDNIFALALAPACQVDLPSTTPPII